MGTTAVHEHHGFAAARGSTPSLADQPLIDNWGWLLALGIVELIAGMFAIGWPAAGTLAVTWILAGVLFAWGIMQAVHAFQTKGWKGTTLELIGALLILACGVGLLVYPIASAAALTVFISAFLIVEGAVRCVTAFSIRPVRGWGWSLAGGLAGIVLGVMLFAGFPGSALWAIGLLVGVNLLFGGATNISWAFALKGLKRELELGERPVARVP